MPLVLADRVNETTTTTSTGTITLAGAVSGYQSFAVIGNGNTTYYTIVHQTANEWEVGIGTYTSSGTTLSRDTVLASSNSGSLVNFSAGTKFVFCDYPAGRAVYLDTATNVTIPGLTLSGGTANGVLYLNGSKVATSGSALVFDGSNLLIGQATNAQNYRLVIKGSAGSADDLAFNSDATRSEIQSFNSKPLELNRQGNNVTIGSAGSGNLGIGTSSPGYKLSVAGASGSAVLNLLETGVRSWGVRAGGTATNTFDIADFTAGATRLTIDSSGNLGIGTTSPASKLTVSGDVHILSTNYLNFTNTAQQTYIRAPASNTIAFGTSSTEQMRLTDTGLLGIGTASPAAKFETFNSAVNAAFVANTSSTWRVAQVRNNGTVNANNAAGIAFVGRDDVQPAGIVAINSTTGGGVTSLAFLPVNSNVTFEAMRLDSSGNLGIGTASPAYRLVAVRSGDGITAGFAGGTYGIRFDNGGTFSSGASTIHGVDSTLTGSYQPLNINGSTLRFQIGANERARIDSSGNFVVGFTSGLSAATNRGNVTINGSASSILTLGVGNVTKGYALHTGTNMEVFNSANGFLAFGTNNTERARITSGGELLVGTTATTSGARLDVKGVDSTASNYCVFFENSGSNLLLAVQNDGRWRSGTAAASPYNFVVGATNRDLFVDNAGEIGYVSSVRASKTNIAPVADTDWLLQLNPVTFNFRKRDEDGNYTDEADGPIKHGLIAEEVEAVNSDLCFYDDEDKGGALRGVNYSHLITPMLKLIQKQQAAIAALEAKVTALESR